MTALREGFTTGTAASATAKAAVMRLAGLKVPTQMDTPLPGGDRIIIPIARTEDLEDGPATRAVVVKDAGDDPDVTDGAEIHCLARFDPALAPGVIELHGGQGVGRTTLPGLPVPPGRAAINPAPRAQILAAAKEAAALASSIQTANALPGIILTVEVPDGEHLAKKTMNPRLGIVGGISILGTRGTVRPFSHEAWQASIDQNLDVARAQGLTSMALTTGGRTARLARTHRPDLDPLAVVQAADFFADTLTAAASRGFTEIVVSCFFGKLVKQAQGFANTHAKNSRTDFPRLARWLAQAGCAPKAAKLAATANTARHALEIISKDPALTKAMATVTSRALASARGFAGPGPALEYRVYDYEEKPFRTMRLEGRK